MITQSAMVFTTLVAAFSLIVTQFQSLSNYAAVVSRLGSLVDAFESSLEVRLEVSEQQQVMAITVVLGQCAIQLQGFAAPRSEGIWSEVRDEISAEVTKQGGVIDKGIGAFGPELRARVPVRLPDGNQGVQVVRFLGADGPRWFLRAVISGQAAVQPQAPPWSSRSSGTWSWCAAPRRWPRATRSRCGSPAGQAQRPGRRRGHPGAAGLSVQRRRGHQPVRARPGDHRDPVAR